MIDAFKHVLTPTLMFNAKVFVTVTWTIDGCLSLTGVEGPYSSGNCAGDSGQITLNPKYPNRPEGWNEVSVKKLQGIWDAWHLNDMRAGSVQQRAYLSLLTYDPSCGKSHHEWACEQLEEVGLQPDADSYHYGSGWLKDEVPESIVRWLYELPQATVIHPWGSHA